MKPSILFSTLLLASCTSTIGQVQHHAGTPLSGQGIFSHIDTLEPRGYQFANISNRAARDEAVDWLLSHVDATGGGTWSTELLGIKDLSPKTTTFVWLMDHTLFHKDNDANIPEEYFLHFSEDTDLEFNTRNGGEPPPDSSVHIVGCPEGTPVAKSCRVQSYMWDDMRWVFHMGNPDFQEWMAQKLLTEVGLENGVFLDEHMPGFKMALYWAGQAVPGTTLVSGGAVRELNGLRPSEANLPDKTYNALDELYNEQMADWFSYLHSQFEAAQKFVTINPAGYYKHELSRPNILAAGGALLEWVHRPQEWASSTEFQDYIDLIKELHSQGGVADLWAGWRYYEPNGYTPGNYASALIRFHMWRLAAYYLVRAPLESPGIVFFDTNFNVNTSTPMSFTEDWLPAFEWNIGKPEGGPYVFQTLSRTCSGQSRETTYQIWARNYTNALVLVRPRDSYVCNDYDAAATVTVPSAMKLLGGDGTLGTQATTFEIRNAETLILAK